MELLKVAETIAQVYLKLAQILIILFITAVMIYRKKQHGIRALNWLIAVFSLALLQGIFELIIYWVKVDYYGLEDTTLFRFNELHTIPYSLALLTLFFLAEQMHDMRPSTWKLIVVFSTWGSYMGLLIYDSFSGFDWSWSKASVTTETSPVTHPFNQWFNIFQFVLMVFVLITFWEAYRTSHNPLNKKVSLWMVIGIVIFAVVAFYEVIESLFNISLPGIFDYKALYYSVTFLVLAYAYLRYPYYVFNVPTYVYRIILATKEGIHLYSAEIENPFSTVTEEASDELLASAVSAMTRFMEEASASKGSIKLVELEDRALLVRKEQNMVGMVIAERATRMLRSALGQFVREFIATYKEQLSETWNTTLFKGAEEIIARCFPFVEAKDILRVRTGGSK